MKIGNFARAEKFFVDFGIQNYAKIDVFLGKNAFLVICVQAPDPNF
jgi:hypothetical protein